ncbi:hypothetical protein BDD12DRAFT_896482 [Trichophaea hybrida]|nr:hypothetical protein BDD12DRAFT_896482 [Trichophaea hybrida]
MTIPDLADDTEIFQHLRVYYTLLNGFKGVIGLISMKKLKRIDVVEIQKNPISLGKRKYSLNLGRSGDSLVDLLSRRGDFKNRQETVDLLRCLGDDEGLELIRGWDPQRASLMVVLLVAASMAFIITWVSVFIHGGHDVQATVGTAFTGGGYIVTAGAVFLALVGFLDTKY